MGAKTGATLKDEVADEIEDAEEMELEKDDVEGGCGCECEYSCKLERRFGSETYLELKSGARGAGVKWLKEMLVKFNSGRKISFADGRGRDCEDWILLNTIFKLGSALLFNDLRGSGWKWADCWWFGNVLFGYTPGCECKYCNCPCS